MDILPNIKPQDQYAAVEEFRPIGEHNLTWRVLFVCVENAGRSQMAEGFAKANGLMASSAGTVPAEKVNPIVVEAMKEKGITLSVKPRLLTEEMIREADLVVTMGCSVEEVCPAPVIQQMQKKLVDWHVEDPKAKPLEEVRKIRTQIENKVMELKDQADTVKMRTEFPEDATIGAAKQEDLHDIFALLDECDLPKDELAPHLSTTVVARNGNQLVGCAALELYEEFALLRSVAVRTSFRGRALGVRLTKAALDMARLHHVKAVFLLTETAETFFTKLGFASVPRSEVPQNVQQSVEFTTLCPDTATVMSISADKYKQLIASMLTE
jgi:protein-tyrosine-phosphatase/N-acetylglutamate synthase-like GNAT family acetyltransferase